MVGYLAECDLESVRFCLILFHGQFVFGQRRNLVAHEDFEWVFGWLSFLSVKLLLCLCQLYLSTVESFFFMREYCGVKREYFGGPFYPQNNKN